MDNKQLAIEILEKHLQTLTSISKENLEQNPMLLYVVSESIKTCSLSLVIVGKL